MRLFFLVTSLLLFVSCHREAVNLSETTAAGEVPQLGNLTFRFSRPVVSDSVLNNWDSTAYVRFTPEIPGRFRWVQPDQLVFSPARPLPPATSFRAELSDEILAGTKFRKIKNAGNINFYTPALELEEVRPIWVLAGGSTQTAVPQLELYFNYPVDPAKLKEQLRIMLDDRPVSAEVLSISPTSRVILRLPGTKSEDKNRIVEVTVGQDMLPVGGSDKGKADITGSSTISSPFNLSVNDISSEHDGLSGSVTVYTSQPVTGKLSPYIAITPAVKFTLDEAENGFVIKSEEFQRDKTYVLTINKGIRGTVGGTLQEQTEKNIAFGEMEPSLRFMSNRSAYLSAKGNRMIEMRIVNVPKVKVVISKIYENNLLAAQRYGYYPMEASGDDYGGYQYENNAYTAGEIIYEKEIETRLLPQMGDSRLFHFNVDDKLPEFKGVYHIRVRSTTDYWMADDRFISVSDLGMIAKEGRSGLNVFVNSIKTAEAITGVNVTAYGNNNQILARGATDANGVAQMEYTRREFAGFRPALIVAQTAADFNYLPFSISAVNMSRFDIGGKKSNSSLLDAFIYAERDIYRPSEDIRYSVIVRDRLWQTPGGIPVKFKVLLPNGKELANFRKSLNEQGSAEGTIHISPAAITGTYTLELYTSNEVLLAAHQFNVEEFVPDRIKVTAGLNKQTFLPGETANLSINAMNFFGPPAAGRNYEAEVQISARSFSPTKFRQHNFSIQNQGITLDKVLMEGRLDEEGNALENYIVPALFKNAGVLKANFYTTVFDETGRPVSRITTADIFTQSVFFGIAEDGYWYYPLNQEVSFGIIGLDRFEKPVSGAKAVVKMIKHEYRTVLAKSGSYFRYDSQQEEKVVDQQIVSVSGDQTRYRFVPRSPGNYELRIYVDSVSGYVSKKFYSYGSWGGSGHSFEVSADGNIDIETDRSLYAPGETARVLFKTPFDGKLLVTLESDQVISHQYVQSKNRVAALDVKISSSYLPNIFITATLIKPHNISDIPLTTAHGFQNVKVQSGDRMNKVTISAQKTTRSKSTQQVTINAEPGSFVTLAAVDNGVLQVSDFKTPDPYAFFYAPRALEVSAYDMYPLLYPEISGRRSSTGGDESLDMKKRVNPMPSERIQILSYWSGIVKTNSQGQAKFEIEIPRFSGQVRLMAVAYRNESFGSAESVITVADPLVISAAMPRFLSPGDSIDVPVTIANTTANNTKAVVGISTTGPLSISSDAERTLTVAANREANTTFRVAAGVAIDTAKLTVRVNTSDGVFVDEIPIGVRPASPLLVHTGSGSVNGGSTETITLPTNDFLPGTFSSHLTISRTPVTEFGENLRFLMQYPYGCTEQIISSVFPQLYFSDLARLFHSKQGSAAVNENILEAIRKIRLRQLYNGALTLWENEGTEHWWTTVYAAHFLLEAKRAGFEPDQRLLDGLLSYINHRLRTKQTITYYYNKDQKKKIAPKEVAYSLYVLALAARPNVSAMNYYKENAEMLSIDSKYLLAAAYLVSGDKKRSADILPDSFSGEVSVPQTGGSFYSPIRDEAISLNALLDTDPSNTQIPAMAKRVGDRLKQGRSLNTQETVFGVLAVGKLSRAAANASVTADIVANGKTAGRFTGDVLHVNTAELQATNIKLVTKGTGKLYYSWQNEGISTSRTFTEVDNNIRIRREFFDRNGRKLNHLSFKQNDLVIVRLLVDRAHRSEVSNVVITDMLPAGFEIENPRTKEIPGMDWIKNAEVPMSLDIRDDRINLFVDLNKDQQVYYYAVRAVTPGVFHMGPASAVAMYNPDFHSYHGAGTVTIHP